MKNSELYVFVTTISIIASSIIRIFLLQSFGIIETLLSFIFYSILFGFMLIIYTIEELSKK